MVLEKVAIENHKKYLERIELYKSFGYDIEKERKFIIKKAEPLYGDILEVGTGKGYFTIVLAEAGFEFTSIDVSEEEQNFARQNLKYLGLDKRVTLKIDDAENLSFKDNSFDIIFSVGLAHHLQKPYKSLDELARVVTFEGKIILSDFNCKGLEMIDKVHQAERRRHSLEPVDFKGFAKYLCDKGFRVERHESKNQEVVVAYHQLI